MNKCQNYTYLFIFSLCLIVIPAFSYYAYARQKVIVEQLHIDNKLYDLSIKLNKKTRYKVVQIDKKEVIIAFKDSMLSDNLFTNGSGKFFVDTISVKHLPDNIILFSVNTKENLKAISSKWRKNQSIIVIHFKTKRKSPAITPRASFRKTDEKKNTEKQQEDLPISNISKHDALLKSDPSDQPIKSFIKSFENIGQKSSKVLGKNKKKDKIKMLGSIDDFIFEVKNSKCIKDKIIKANMTYCDRKLYSKAFSNLSKYIEDKSSGQCIESAFFLKAYCFYKMNGQAGINFEATNYFQDAINYFPDSKYMPYAIAALGKINSSLSNYIEAKGYLKIVLSKYKNYNGMPEVLVELGNIYFKQKKYKLAISTFKKVISNYHDALYTSQAKYILGKALYKTNEFEESINILTKFINNTNKKYEHADLLLYIGNSYFQLGKFEKAFENLAETFNLFPEADSNHLTLTRMADICNEMNATKKAQIFYQLVTEKFLGTDGFVISSMRLADNYSDPEEKKAVYKTIIGEYPDNPMARLALLKLAIVFNKNGEHEESIETIKKLRVEYPNVLRKEAMYTMKESYTFLFDKLLNVNNYPELLFYFEQNKQDIRKLKSPDLYYIVGKAYQSARLFDKAVDYLNQSYALFDKKKRTADLTFRLGLSLYESGQQEKVLEILDIYTASYSTDHNFGKAFNLKGKIYHKKGKFGKSINNFEKAYKYTKLNDEKAAILIDEAKGYTELNNYTAVSPLLIKAINMLSSSTENHFDSIFIAYKMLGENYLKLKSYDKAADSFGMAIKFLDKEKPNMDLLFLKGESYQKAKKIKMAEKTFKKIVDSENSFWKKLAQEKLREMKINSKLNKS